MKLFRNRRMVEHLTIKLSAETNKNAKSEQINCKLIKTINNIKQIALTYQDLFLIQLEHNEKLYSKLQENQSSNCILRDQLLGLKRELEISKQNEKNLNHKISNLSEENNKLISDLDKAREIIKQENKLNFIYKNRKDAKEYGKLKNERN